jgi:hypothetical protein
MPAPGQTAEAYDQQVRRDALSAEALQGPLDGGFVLSRPGGPPLYAFQLVDPRVGDAGLEGAWRKLVRRPHPRDFGFVGLMAHDGPQLVLRFDERPGRLVVVTVQPQEDGLWRGRMWRLGFTRPVILRKQPF